VKDDSMDYLIEDFPKLSANDNDDRMDYLIEDCPKLSANDDRLDGPERPCPP